MKELLTQIYKKHKKETVLSKIEQFIDEKVPTFSRFFTYSAIASIIPTCFTTHYLLIPSSFIPSMILNTLGVFISISFLGLMMIVLLSEFSIKADNKLKKYITQLLEASNDEQIKQFLCKLNLISINNDELSEEAVLDDETFNTLISNLKNPKFTHENIKELTELICAPKKLDFFYEKNQNLIAMPNDELLTLVKSKLSKIIEKEEINRQMKMDFLKENKSHTKKEDSILKVNKKLTLSL